jgi:hypothetical protein
VVAELRRIGTWIVTTPLCDCRLRSVSFLTGS